MDDDDLGLRPPYGPAPGPTVDDATVLSCFIRGDPAGHSEGFYVEANQLIAGGDIAIALRLSDRTVLLRNDLPPDAVKLRGKVEAALEGAGMERFDEHTLLGLPVAVQLAGIRFSDWDLWGSDIDGAFADLRASAVGEQTLFD